MEELKTDTLDGETQEPLLSGPEPSLPDLVYPLRPRNSNGHEELRHSLRSVCTNLPHGTVWVLSPMRPKWLTSEVQWLRTRERSGEKWANLPNALRAACTEPEISQKFLYMNDDFFVMEPVDEMPVLHRGFLTDTRGYIKPSGTYGRGYRDTGDFLVKLGMELGELYNYELHVPLPVDKGELSRALRMAEPFKGRCLQTRTLYGNLACIGGEQSRDVKIHGRAGDLERPFLSTNDTSFVMEKVGKRIRAAFPEACKYERTKA